MFRCTDIGTRVVVAVKLGPREVSRAESVDGGFRITKRIDDDPSWLNGPPYAIEELVFDENELVGCFRSEAELLGDDERDIEGERTTALRDGADAFTDAGHRRQVAVGMRQHQRLDLPGSRPHRFPHDRRRSCRQHRSPLLSSASIQCCLSE